MTKKNPRQKFIFEFMGYLTELWLNYPEQRFGQILYNYTRIGTRKIVGTVLDPFHYLDSEMLGDIKKNLK